MLNNNRQLLLCIIAILTLPANPIAAEPNWSVYSQLLQAHVQLGNKHDIALNIVDYQAIKADKRWFKTLATLAEFNETTLLSETEKLAFWINAYNILAINMVLQHWPLQSIRDAGNFFSPVWKKEAGVVAGKVRTLYEIEHQILRPMGEPRIHFAIVCASVSCPDLKPTPYDAAHIHDQLEHQARLFITNPDKGVRIQKNKLHISKIFDWFKDDFQAMGGVVHFIHQYRFNTPADSHQPYFLDYDWSLNATD